jgi:hypothetical protein
MIRNKLKNLEVKIGASSRIELSLAARRSAAQPKAK